MGQLWYTYFFLTFTLCILIALTPHYSFSRDFLFMANFLPQSIYLLHLRNILSYSLVGEKGHPQEQKAVNLCKNIP